MSLVDRIKLSGEKKGLNLTQIERGSGLTNRTIYKWDKSSPSIDKVLAVANFLNESLYWLVTGTEEDTKNRHSEFLNKYEMLSDLDKKKIEHFMDIALIDLSTYNKISEKDTPIIKEDRTTYSHSDKIIAILGYVAAGKPIEGISIPLGYLPAPVPADYALIAKGMSMEPVIHDGEIIFVQKCESLKEGDLGIFYIDGDVTCKKYHPEVDHLLLKSLNPDYAPFKYSLNEQHDFKIQGRVMLTPEQNSRLND